MPARECPDCGWIDFHGKRYCENCSYMFASDPRVNYSTKSPITRFLDTILGRRREQPIPSPPRPAAPAPPLFPPPTSEPPPVVLVEQWNPPRLPRPEAMPLNPDAQPPPALNSGIRAERTHAELIGLIRGVLSDGVLTEGEVIGIARWMLANAEHAPGWPVSVILDRLNRALADENIDAEEMASIEELFRQVIGGKEIGSATKLPLTQPPPRILFREHQFVLTGKFIFGTRKACEAHIARRGGFCAAQPTQKTDYLVIGSYASRDWIQTTHGRKIIKAAESVERGAKLAIVSEEHWVQALEDSDDD